MGKESHLDKPREWWIEYLDSMSTPCPVTGCHLWLGWTNPSGYGRKMIGSKGHMAHRLSYEAHKGQIPKGMVIDHLCRVRSCINPDHLEAVTENENIRRGKSPIASKYNLTHCLQGHEFTLKNTYFDKNGGRSCRTCRRIWEKKQPKRDYSDKAKRERDRAKLMEKLNIRDAALEEAAAAIENHDPENAELIRSLKATPSTPPATQAEPKLYERRYSTGDLAMRSPDTRNPSEADRRAVACGQGKRSGETKFIFTRIFPTTHLGRRAGDSTRWVGGYTSDAEHFTVEQAQQRAAELFATPQPAAEVSEDPVWEKPSAWVTERFTGETTGKFSYDTRCYSSTLLAFAEHLERYIDERVRSELDKRGRGS